MRILIQRVNRASVSVDNKMIASIDQGLLLLVGFGKSDCEQDIQIMVNKLLKLRLFPSKYEKSKFDLSVEDIGGGILVVSQFTLYANCNSGRRPSFSDAMPPEEARNSYNSFCNMLKLCYQGGPIAEGSFGAYMQIDSENDGPVTIMMQS